MIVDDNCSSFTYDVAFSDYSPQSAVFDSIGFTSAKGFTWQDPSTRHMFI